MPRVTFLLRAVALLSGVLCLSQAQNRNAKPPDKAAGAHFETSDRCFACHNGISTPSGEDISIGLSWRPTMMANSARDPYWLAGVRRETIDHPAARAAIEDECSICHMPMARHESKLAGHEGEIFSHLPFDRRKISDRLAADGVSCPVCHQIEDKKLGTRESFVGGFVIDPVSHNGERRAFGPFEIDAGRTTVMRSSSGFRPAEAKHIRQSELCATCHTLYTTALGAQGQPIGELPEQVPYQEWLHSEYRTTTSCQACHMPEVSGQAPITSVLGQSRSGMARHVFVGGNFFMPRLLNRYRDDLGVTALPQELESAAVRTVAHLESEAARIAIRRVEVEAGRLNAEVAVENLGGHKLPTAYPSRRVWLRFTVRDPNRAVVFESGALNADGSIRGNDNDADPNRYEPHFTEIRDAGQVQVYESIMVDEAGRLTTGLLTALRYAKDNRLLPKGFDKRTAPADVAVHGGAADDPDFTGGGDSVRYSVALGAAQGPFEIEAELWYQPIAYRWASNLRTYGAQEPRRFAGYFDSMASASAVLLVRASAQIR